MPAPVTFPSGFSTGVFALERPLVQPLETIGSPRDAPATDVDDENSMFALLKGMLVGLGVPAGGGVNVNAQPHMNNDLAAALGNMDDPPATDVNDTSSAISLLKGCCALLGL